MLSQSTRPIASNFLSRHHLPRPDARHESLQRATKYKTRPIYFQSLTHSSRFTNRAISSIFLALRTLCQKHPGVPLALLTKFSRVSLTLIESICLGPAHSNPFRILLFKNTHAVTPLKTYSFTKQGGGGRPSALTCSRDGESSRACSVGFRNVHFFGDLAGAGQLRAVPPAAEGFDQLHGGGHHLGVEVGQGLLVAQQRGLRDQDR
jgi:hypothetical protein